jgi:hypothetical protein
MKRALLLTAFFLFFAGTTLHAQSKMPSNQFGLGFFLEPGTGGLSGTYAISHNIHVGTYLSLGVGSVNGNSSPTTFLFAPFFRILFPGVVNPFVEGNVQVQGSGVAGESQTDVGIGFGGGIAYGISQNFDVDFDLGLIGVGFTHGGSFSFGFSNVGVEGKWFF